MSSLQSHTSTQVRTNPLAVASLVFSLLWLGGLGALFAVLCGHTARRQIRYSGSAQGGDALALAGIIIGWVGVAFALFVWIAILPMRPDL